MATNKNQHFVPQHYLRQFAIRETELTAVARISPFLFVDEAPIKRQCQQDYFYADDGNLDEILRRCETDLAPVLVRVCEEEQFNDPDQVALRFFAVVLHSRARKVVEASKVFDKFIAGEVLKSAVAAGRLPPPPGGWTDNLIDFKGAAGRLAKNVVIPCWLEMATLGCKLLKSPPECAFVTSDNPVVMLNQLLERESRERCYAGFSRSGFQLVLPLSPRLCAFFFDPRVYKVGNRNDSVVRINPTDVEIVNGLQVLSAEACLYCHDKGLRSDMARLVGRFSNLRKPVSDHLKATAGQNPKETFLLVHNASVRLPGAWGFCRLLKNRKTGRDHRRCPDWSALVSDLMADMDKNPTGGDVFRRLERLLGCSFSAASDQKA